MPAERGCAPSALAATEQSTLLSDGYPAAATRLSMAKGMARLFEAGGD